jgi:hypothetical protein
MCTQHQAGVQMESGQKGVTSYFHTVHGANQEILQLLKTV